MSEARDEEVSKVDWEEVRRVMEQVDPTGELSDPRFDPLKRALQILSSYTSAGDLDEVKGFVACHFNLV